MYNVVYPFLLALYGYLGEVSLTFLVIVEEGEKEELGGRTIVGVVQEYSTTSTKNIYKRVDLFIANDRFGCIVKGF